MRKSKRNFLGLGISLFFIGLLVYFVINVSPDNNFSLLSFSLPTLPAFFILLFASLLFLFSFLLNNQRQGFFVSLFATIYLILRLNNLTHPFFLILILALFATFELLFKKRK